LKKRKTILLIEDERTIQELIKTILEKEGYKIIPAYSGKEGIEIAEKEKPNLILLDIFLPDINGIEVCSAIKSNSKTSAIPIIMCTAVQRIGDMDKAIEKGAADYIMKPLNIEKLKTKVSQFIS
ncbi:unnamed protein product, partial [marine sediment metagenome]